MVKLATRPTFILPEPTETKDQLQAIKAFQLACRQFLIPDIDYGTIPGTDRPTLLKPGAEKLVRLLGLADEYDLLTQDKDWGKGFFHFVVRCRLIHLATGTVVSTGLGECNSMEARYRWRWVFRSELDRLGISTEGLRTRPIDTRNGKATLYRVENEDIYSQVNTILKMSKKRSLVDAALSAGRLSEVFHQDFEDTATENGETVQAPPKQAEPKPQRPGPAQVRESHAEQLGTCIEHERAWAPLSTGEIGHPLDDGGWCYKDDPGITSENDEAWNDLTEGAEQGR